MKSITSFDGPYLFLSNFYPVVVKLGGWEFPTVENAYQAAKAAPNLRIGFTGVTPRVAKSMGRSIELPADWEHRKVDVMRDLLEQKFAIGSALADRLLATREATLIENNWWGDTFWGVCKGVGRNELGQLLMLRRSQLRSFK